MGMLAIILLISAIFAIVEVEVSVPNPEKTDGPLEVIVYSKNDTDEKATLKLKTLSPEWTLEGGDKIDASTIEFKNECMLKLKVEKKKDEEIFNFAKYFEAGDDVKFGEFRIVSNDPKTKLNFMDQVCGANLKLSLEDKKILL